MLPNIFKENGLKLTDVSLGELTYALKYLRSVPLAYESKTGSVQKAEEDAEEDIYGDIGIMELLMLGIPINNEPYKEGIGKILATDLEETVKNGYRVRIVNLPPNSKIDYQSKELEDLGYKITECKVCWDPLKEPDTVLGHLLDIQKGGSYVMFVEKNSESHVFNRFFELRDVKGDKELFWDTVEGRNTLRFSVKSWEDDGVLHELALSIAGFLALAKKIGASRAYFAEFETEEFLKGSIGNNSSRAMRQKIGTKIGVQPYDIGPKPFFYKYMPGSSKYFIELNNL